MPQICGFSTLGVKPKMVGRTTKLLVLCTLPPGAKTRILPMTALAGTVAVSWPLWLTTNVAGVLPKKTSVAPARFVPVMTTLVPACTMSV